MSQQVSPTLSTESTAPSGRVTPGKIAFWFAVIALCVFCLAPILWQVLTSFKVNEDIAALPNVYFPSRLTLAHYVELFTRRPFLRYILNSAIVALASTAVCLAIGAPAAYALARLRPLGGKVIQAGIVLVTLFPGILLLQGLLEIVQWLRLGNNYLALIIPYTAINLPLTILVMRSFFQQLPKDLEDAAKDLANADADCLAVDAACPCHHWHFDLHFRLE